MLSMLRLLVVLAACLGTTGAVATRNDSWARLRPAGSRRARSLLQTGYQYELTIGSPSQLDGVSGILPLPNGLLLVADEFNYRLLFFRDDGSVAGVLGTGTQGSGPNEFDRPNDAALSPDGEKLFIVDSFNRRVKVYTLDPNENGILDPGEPALDFIFGSSGASPGQFLLPLGIVTGADGIYVTDYQLSRITKFNFTGAVVWFIGQTGTGNGEFRGAVGCAIGRNVQVGPTLVPEVLYVADNLNNRVQYFDASNGAYLGQFGGSGSQPGQLAAPAYIDVTVDGNVVVADTGNHRIQRLDPTGNPQLAFGTQGTGPGQFQDASKAPAERAPCLWLA
ncbi:hypothetical protein ABPG77_009950 [Micractinium sp. CCAP 211/92]